MDRHEAPSRAVGAMLLAAVLLASTPRPADAVVQQTVDAAPVVWLDVPAALGDELLIDLPVGGRLLTCVLRPRSVRAPGYRVLVAQPGGRLEPAAPSPVHTLRGSVLGVPGSVVTATLRPDGLEMIVLETPWAEPLHLAPVPGGPRGAHRLTHGDDAAQLGDLVCGMAIEARRTGTTDAGDALGDHDRGRDGADGGSGLGDGSGAGGTGGPAGAGDACFDTAVLAFDADHTYFEKFGSVEAVELRLEAVVSTLNVWYERDLQISHEIGTIVVRPTPEADPYSNTEVIAELLGELVAHWNETYQGVPRAMAQLVTDRVFTDPGSGVHPVGNAFYREVCTGLSYSVVKDVGGLNCSAYVAAHELGHNWGSDHCACSSDEGAGCPAGVCPPGEDCFCPGWIMSASYGCATAFHPEHTVPEMIAYRDTRPCLVDPCVPRNDHCADALDVPDGAHELSTASSTTDGPPEALCNANGSVQIDGDVWFRYVPSCDGAVAVDVCDTDFDARLAVYQAFCPSASGQAIACDDDGCGAGPSLVFDGQAGTVYLLRVGGTNDAVGTGTLVVSGPTCEPPPPNDDCGSAVTVGEGVAVAFTTVGATADGPELPDGCGGGGGPLQIERDVWFRFLAPCDGPLTVGVCGAGFDTMLAVYGAVCPSGAPLACDDDGCGGPSRLTFDAVGGALYRVRIGSASGEEGSGSILVSCGPPATCPTDTDGNGVTDVDDLVAVILDWGTPGAAHSGDVNGSGGVDVDDLVAVILAWGPC